MFKALTATAAVIICCLGNQYPAKACPGCSYEQQLSHQQDQFRRHEIQAEHERYLIRHEMQQRQQRYGGQW